MRTNGSARLNTVLCISLMLCATNSVAFEKGDFVLSLVAMDIAPANANDPIINAVSGTLANTFFSVDAKTTPAAALTYFLSDQLAIETYFGGPPAHEVYISGFELFNIDSVATITVAPLVVLFQYHYEIPKSPLTVHAGTGFVYTHYYDIEVKPNVKMLDSTLDFDVADSFGYTVQVGVLWKIKNRFTARASFGKLYFDADATISSSLVGNLSSTVAVDPKVMMVGIGYHY